MQEAIYRNATATLAVNPRDAQIFGGWSDVAMMKSSSVVKLAVLIDADNVSAQIADGLFKEIAKIGEANIRRAYGDFSSTRLGSWGEALSRHAVQPRQQFACVPGKNSSDIALVIDAMDLLHREDIDAFCIVSSDSDFTGLAIRMREAGAKVYGFGKRTTVEAFRHACDQFYFVDALLPPVQANVVRLSAAPIKAPAQPARVQPAKLAPAQAIALLKQAFSKTKATDGWVDIGPLGSVLAKEAPTFDTRRYGAKKLSDLVRRTNAFEVVQGSGRMRVRLKAALK